MTPLGQLGKDDRAPFRFKKGDRVVWITPHRQPSTKFRGEIVDGWCDYPDDLSGVMREVYFVQEENGSVFPAEGINLTKV